mgnify:CR=1 FL=1
MRKWMAALLTAGVACHAGPSPERSTNHPLEHHAYVWQRVWTPSVQAAVDAAEAEFSDRMLLAVESDSKNTIWTGLWSLDGQPKRNPSADWEPDATRRLGSVSLALRWADADRALQPGEVLAQVRLTLERAEQRGWAVDSVHLDADIPTGRLGQWAAVLAAIEAASPVDIAVLTLVDHVDKPGWTALTEAVDTVVLQVHSVPVEGVDRPVLFDPETARRAVSAAVTSSGAPLQVALPTHTLTDARTGGAVRAEPAVVARWLDAASNPIVRRLAGVTWFRLPVSDVPDTWSADTLADVRAGVVPLSVAAPALGRPPAGWGAADTARAVYVASTGRDHAWLSELEVCVPKGRLAVATMDLRYQDRAAGETCVVLEPRVEQLLAPGERVAVALVLADAEPEVRRRGAPTEAVQ